MWVGGIASSVAQNAHDIQTLDRRLTLNDSETHDMQILMGEHCRQLATVEVQMGTVETIINKTQASDQRIQALLWNKGYGQTYPDIFYPVSIPHESMPCMK